MSQSLAAVYVHIVFSTKNRAPLIPSDMLEELHRYMGGVLKHHNCAPLQVGGIEDHVHVLTSLSRTMTIAHVIERVKSSSTNWMQSRGHAEFRWQGGYGAFSASKGELARLDAYIRNQVEHHRTVSFQEELLALFEEAGIEPDQRFLWDD